MPSPRRPALWPSRSTRTCAQPDPTPFTGYTELSTESKVAASSSTGRSAEAAEEGDLVEVVLERTPFYAESGGQDSDAGTITGDGVALEVVDVQRPVKGLIVHKVGSPPASCSPARRCWRPSTASGGSVPARPIRAPRDARSAAAGARPDRAAERLVQQARLPAARLRLADGLSQQIRCDVEEAANQAIRSDLNVTATIMPLAKAREIGALALFGETYDEEVRVVEMGGPWSRELCGGTHVQHSSQIGLVTLTGESSVGSGVRRVEAFVGIEAFRYLAKERSLVLD